MRTLILYSTKSGASRECAELLATKIEDCSVCDIRKSTPDIESYDTLIVGSGVRMGKIYKPTKNFIDKNTDILLSKNTAFYLCNSYSDTLQKVIENNIPKKLVDTAICIKSFGGKPPFTSPKNQDWVLVDNINALAQAVTAKE